MIKTLIKFVFFGILAYLVVRFPGTVGDLAANAVVSVRDTATSFFTKIG
ncbi:hypothetical protein Aple_034290 [Acrocarpospora pleiomorpha]|uniref:Uncharacterized protein n=1 Tax=Acrocarpospora pleiomorpha TaxID=90975 RepID=A0A5M3XMZ4_9ACTN|nr:hypothetical protein [Acrocarpospora pleiomorpha]GES20533.1 hypothetical protein Aple_034290 [Acrocarpospora pleiomorpha]